MTIRKYTKSIFLCALLFVLELEEVNGQSKYSMLSIITKYLETFYFVILMNFTEKNQCFFRLIIFFLKKTANLWAMLVLKRHGLPSS